MRRYVIKLNDKSTSGAIVTEGAGSARHHGTPIAVIGASIYCSACKSEGRIVATGLRRHTSIMGKQIALENDFGMCKCKPTPRMIPSQSNLSQSFTSEELSAQGYTPRGVPFLAHHDERITLRDHRTQRPIANVQYRVKDDSQILAMGMTDANGRTERIVTNEASNVVIEVHHVNRTGGERR